MTHTDIKNTSAYFSELIVRVGSHKERSAFKELYQEFYPRIKSYLRSLKVTPEAIEDLAQDVMMSVWRKAEQYNPDKAAPVTWIFTIARNRFIDTHIRKKKYNFTEQDASFFMNDIDDPSENLHRKTNYNIIADALKKLSPEHAELIKMVYFQELTHNSVSEVINLPLGTVKSRIRTALSHLRKHIHIKDFKDC